MKKIVILIISLGLLAAMFFAGIAFFAVAAVLLPVIFLYQKYKMDKFWNKVAEAKEQQQQQVKTTKTIEAEYEIIEEREE